MADNYVQVPANSTGVKLQTFENIVNAQTVDSEAVTLVRSSDNTEVGTSSQPVRTDPTGTTTQPVSAASLPLPTGAATSAKQPALGTAGTAATDVITVQGIASMTALKVDGSAVTQPVSASSLPLPTGASTAAKQPALGTAGTASADVITVQGIASMTALKVDGSAVTQPVSAASLPLPTGAATAAKQPALGTAGTASSDVITVQGITSMTALKVDGSGVTQPVSAASLPLPTGASTAAKQPALGTAGSASSDVITVQGIASMTALKVDLSATAANATAVKVDNSAVTQPVQESATMAVTLARSSSNPSSSGDNTIISAQGVGKVIYVYAYSLSFSGTVNAKFTDGAAGTQLAFHYGVANSGGGEAVKPPTYLWKGTANTALILNLSGATAVACNLSYYVV